MSNTLVFTFEDTSLSILGDNLNPLFIVQQICAVLGYSNPRKAISDHCDTEDVCKVEVQTKGGKQLVNCVNESGLYALIFGSKLPKAKQFKRWVTSEVLPTIRKQGQYQCPAPIQDDSLSPAEQFSIRNAVAKKAKKSPSTYRFIYSLLKQRFQVARYSQISTYDFREALNFIKELKLPAPYSEPLPAPARTPAEYDDEDQTYKLTISRRELERFGTFIYNWRYQFHDALVLYVNHLVAVKSPYSRKLYDATFDSSLQRLEELFREHGISIGPDLPNPERLRTLAYSI